MNAIRDANRVAVNLGVSSADGVTILPWKINPATGRIIIDPVFTTPLIFTVEKNSARDQNRVESMLGVDASNPNQTCYVTSINGNILIETI